MEYTIKHWKGKTMGKLIIDGNSVYEVDEDCLKQKEKEEGRELLEYKDLDSKTTKKRLP